MLTIGKIQLDSLAAVREEDFRHRLKVFLSDKLEEAGISVRSSIVENEISRAIELAEKNNINSERDVASCALLYLSACLGDAVDEDREMINSILTKDVLPISKRIEICFQEFDKRSHGTRS